jgi:hypothetical protein
MELWWRLPACQTSATRPQAEAEAIINFDAPATSVDDVDQSQVSFKDIQQRQQVEQRVFEFRRIYQHNDDQ